MKHSRSDLFGSNEGTAKADFFVKIVLIFFISLLSFSVGTFVGKQFSDSQYKMAQLEGDGYETQRDPAAVDPASLETTPPDALTEEDIASLEEEFSKGKTVDSDKSEKTTAKASSHAEATKDVAKQMGNIVAKASQNAEAINHEAKESKGSVKNLDQKIGEVAHKVLNGQAPVSQHQEGRRTPSSLPKTVANDVIGKYTVQVSSYNNEPDAVEHTKALKEKGFSAFYIPATIKGKTWFRVNVGLYANSKEADDYRKKIIGQDIKSAIVQKIVQN